MREVSPVESTANADLAFHTLDVFTAKPYGGNPVAVFPDSDGLSDVAMQRIARELNLSETVFVRVAPHPAALRELRIFTPRMELPFAGHPTIGTAQLLVSLGIAHLGADRTARFLLQEAVGLVPVEVNGRGGRPDFAWLTSAQLPELGPPPPDVSVLAALLRLGGDDIVVSAADGPRAWSAGVPYLYVPVRNREALARAQVDLAVWERAIRGFWAPHLYVFTMENGTRPADGVGAIAARMFAPAMGITEDPATGAGVAGIAGYLWAREHRPGRWLISQGVEMGRPSELHLQVDATAGRIERVRVGGAAVLMASGTIPRP